MWLSPIGFDAVNVGGDSLRRALLNFSRLELEEYQADTVFRPADYDWPADHEGRTVLALSLLAQAARREPKYLSEILDKLPLHLNEQGYMGRILAEGFFDEQQLSGHSWLLRGLCEYYLWTNDEHALEMARTIGENLFVPATEAYRAYPAEPEQRGSGGAASGTLTGETHNGWYCSTDIGCAFIPLDGVTHLFEIARDERVKALVESMIARFLEIDLVAAKMQTHATLTACRGILRFFECTGDRALLDSVRRIYDLYRAEAMTENYENYNWFARPEWTEPCAVVDSFMVAAGLWKHTREPKYLDDAHSILFNGLGYGLRPSGGFGTNSCSGARDEFVGPDCYEATWCCVMRGGEGLSRAIEYVCFADEDRVLLPFYEEAVLSVRAGGGEVVFEESTAYPVDGSVVIKVRSSSAVRPIRLGLYVPLWADRGSARLAVNGAQVEICVTEGFAEVALTPRVGDHVELRFGVRPRIEATINRHSIQGRHTLRHGALILGTRYAGAPISMPELSALEYLGNAEYRLKGSDVLLMPIRGLADLSDEAARHDRVQMLF